LKNAILDNIDLEGARLGIVNTSQAVDDFVCHIDKAKGKQVIRGVVTKNIKIFVDNSIFNDCDLRELLNLQVRNTTFHLVSNSTIQLIEQINGLAKTLY